MYSFEQLKIFITVVETGSFSGAARKLKRAQSGVSQAISNLEIAINQDLFTRNKNVPTLTSSGKALLPVAYSILDQQNYFDQKVEALSKHYEHELIIAIDESLNHSGFVQIISILADEYPITSFEIISASTYDIESLVREGKAQVGIVYADGELKADMDFFLLGQARFLTIASPQHELAKLPVVQSSDLTSYRQCAHRSAEQKELWFSYSISAKVWYANTHQTLIDLVINGIGWALVPELAVKQHIKQGDVVVLPVTHEHDGWLTSVGCLISRSQAGGPVLDRLKLLLQKNVLAKDSWKSKGAITHS
ncbi:LysR family transcriptional regulator [Paraglaciecola sp. 20A4]|uniref:LysR family transcriptional regulator n=1 Tax=Paraglaciecola sp. 20A4 TaxID=2687288 RepID=UPI00140975CE|nr:LysR family transcriptional regulator [Paraglaciecola sp. 20A4]